MNRLLSSLCAMVLGTTPVAQAQTMDEALRANLALAIELCVKNISVPTENGLAAFRAAGFTDAGTERSLTAFVAPADTVRVRHTAGLCEITTRMMGVSEGTPFTGAVLSQRFPAATQTVTSHAFGTPNRRCSDFVLRGVIDLPVIVQVGQASQPGTVSGCIDDGSLEINVTVPG